MIDNGERRAGFSVSTDAPSGRAERMMSEIQRLEPKITPRAAEIENARRVPPDLVEALKSIGIFRMFVPRSHGGLEFDMPTGLEIIRALSRIDGSVGWTAMIGSGCALVPALLPKQTYEQVYGNGPDTIIAGSTQPAGKAEAAPGGWRVSGRWAFASGCQHADWMFGLCVMTEEGRPLPGPAGEGGLPLVRGFLMPARHWQIEDTWHVAGLKGTGSHHITLTDQVVPDANFFDLMTGASFLSGPLYRAVPHHLPLFHAAFAIGVAEAAVEALVALACTGKQQFKAPTPMRDSEVFQAELGRVSADLEAARALYQVQTATHWRHALAGLPRDENLNTHNIQAAVWVTAACVRVVDGCFELGGGSALYDSSPLQRQLRDLHVSAQHAMVQRRNYGRGGELLLSGLTP